MSEWNAELYDNKHNFVAEYGKGLLEFVPKNKTVLDLGCGTGILTAQLADFSKSVVGVDSSENMIKKAENQYRNIDFFVCDALDLPFEKQFDVVFSNAVFHWINDHNRLLQNIKKALKPGGMLICEFGAKGNIQIIENAFFTACKDLGYEFSPEFNFPTSEHFADLLKNNGFVTDKIYDYDRPTPLKDNENGLANWIRQFFASELEIMPLEMQNEIIKNTENLTRKKLWNKTEWVADYRRLRAIAHI